MVPFNYGTILDYSASHYIPIQDGNVAIFDAFKNLAHVTNLTTFDELTIVTENLLNHFPQSHMEKLLEAALQQIVKMLDEITIHHRLTNNINLIGKTETSFR